MQIHTAQEEIMRKCHPQNMNNIHTFLFMYVSIKISVRKLCGIASL